MTTTTTTTNAAGAKQPARSNLADLYRTDPLKACRAALKATRLCNFRERMEAINSLLGMHGVEVIRGDWQNGYWCDIVATYANTGDSYDLTVLHVRGETRYEDAGRFIVSSMGDFVERNGAKLGIL